ncbi:TetR/AcrR family transcriptional regulator [Candidatus Marimicrobium litorale]|uniref:TetR/AcrR family transcriptional regulator n=1 Tax=Candidatus Marimicrobium litorale TaxID=2518991 RepID=A0ABT3T4G4_9GAMM|nr:TetR/AcrR family transcriptional regulator [Candidatus Marimicrobium litorale]MCX2977148.1 TetR/AcrR family transcriptional regulator [Candidatus Marimicrobium litorale]
MSTANVEERPQELSQGQNTRERLMDAAESLMAENGLDVVSVRSINKAAGTSVGVMHYHFRSKEELIEAIVLRRMEVLQEARLERYTELLKTDQPTVEEVVEAMVAPYAAMAISDDRTERQYIRFMDRLFVARSPVLDDLVVKHFGRVNRRLFVLMKRALPELSDSVLTARSHQAFLALTSTLAEIAARGDAHRAWQQAVLHPEQQIQALIDFIVGGLKATSHVVEAIN